MGGAADSDAFSRLKREFDEFLSHLPYGVMEVELETGRITFLNRSGRLLLGVDPDQLPSNLNGADVLSSGEFERRWIGRSRDPGSVDEPPLIETHLCRQDGSELPVEVHGSYALDATGTPVRVRLLFRDITARKQVQAERAQRLLPICAWCNRIRDEHGEWQQLESYIRVHLGYDFTHSICPTCDGRMGLPHGRPVTDEER